MTYRFFFYFIAFLCLLSASSCEKYFNWNGKFVYKTYNFFFIFFGVFYFNENLMWHNVVKNACCGLGKANKLKNMCTNKQKFIKRNDIYICRASLYKYYEWFILNWGTFWNLCFAGLCVVMRKLFIIIMNIIIIVLDCV